MTTKPKGDHAKFRTDCFKCGRELTITNGRIDYHDCRPITLEQIRDALGK
jgi:hypothetical protein